MSRIDLKEKVALLASENGCLRAELSQTKRDLKDWQDSSEAYRHDAEKAKAHIAALCDLAVYSDSYGVPGSDFACCHFCRAGGAPNVVFKHDDSCPVGRAEATAQEWWDERREAEADRKRATEALSIAEADANKWSGRYNQQIAATHELDNQVNALHQDIARIKDECHNESEGVQCAAIVRAKRAEAERDAMREARWWMSWDSAPKDGRWIVAVCNDMVSLLRVSWGNNREGHLAWCSNTSSYGDGDGLFAGWIDCPTKVFGARAALAPSPAGEKS